MTAKDKKKPQIRPRARAEEGEALSEHKTEKHSGSLAGTLLVATPGMADPRFARTVIYICSHSPAGAMGVVVNRLFGALDFCSLLDQMEIKTDSITPPVRIHYGGPVENNRGFVLHSADYQSEGTVPVDDQVCLTATVDILRAIAQGHGPNRCFLALGYAGWGPGQLDTELQANGWLVAPSAETLLFDDHLETKWERAIAQLGITPASLSAEIGHA